MKRSIVRPLLKKIGADPNDLKNYRPVSNLTFVSKVLEKVVLKQILEHIELNDLQAVFQSAYKKYHSTETALLKVFTDFLDSFDDGKIGFLNLLDLSAAFDTIDHEILLERLENCFGIKGVALDWIKSYLSDRSYVVKVDKYTSASDTVLFGVPQGSVLGPFLFTLYTYPVVKYLSQNNLDFHCYADDKQLYKCFVPQFLTSNLTNVQVRISEIEDWMVRNKLKFNGPKTEFMILGKKRMLEFDKPSLDLGHSRIMPSSVVRNLGVMFDENLDMTIQVDTLCKSLFFTLRTISLNREFMTFDVAKKLVISLVLSKLDYCNVLLAGLPDTLLNKLQRVQNCAAKIIFRKRKYDHVTPLLYELHWLPVKERIDFKVATLCFKSFHDLCPAYISNFLESYKPTRFLRSSLDQTLLKIPLKNSKCYGERSFSFYAPKLWNSLPREMRDSQSLDSFKKALKHYLFLRAYY